EDARERLETVPWRVATFRCSRPGLETELACEPCHCGTPLALGSRWRHFQHTGGFFDGESAEGAKLHDAGEIRVKPRKTIERMIQRQNGNAIWRSFFHGFVDGHRC